MADLSEREIMAQACHKSLPVVRRYIRDVRCFAATPQRQLVCEPDEPFDHTARAREDRRARLAGISGSGVISS